MGVELLDAIMSRTLFSQRLFISIITFSKISAPEVSQMGSVECRLFGEDTKLLLMLSSSRKTVDLWARSWSGQASGLTADGLSWHRGP